MAAIVFIILTAIWFGLGEASQLDCDTLRAQNPECHCASFDYTELHCKIGRNNLNFNFATGSTSYIKIQCDNRNNTLDYFDYLPEIVLGTNISLYLLQVEYCPAPKTSFNEILSKFGVERIRTIIIDPQSNATLERKHFSNLQGVSRITYKGKSFNYPSMDLFSDLTNFTWFTLYEGTEFNLTNETFAKMSKLEHLELDTYHITSIPAGAFSQLKNLSTLLLWGNEHLQLNSKDFEHLENLEVLDLHDNKLMELPPDIFEPLKKLKNLSLMSNNFTSLPDNLFKNNKQLQDFKLLHNNVPLIKLPNRLLADLPHLDMVDLSKCGLQVVPGDLFANSDTVKTIKLCNNQLTTLPKELFEDLSNLVFLDLSSNNLTSLDVKLFERTTSLQVLKLNRNKLEILDSAIFEYQGNLIELYISRNQLHTIHPNCFINTGKITTIDMSHNKLNLSSDSLNSPFMRLGTSLTDLNLSHNVISQFFYDWKYTIASLKDLNLSYNKIVHVSFEELYTISNTISIDLRRNKINTIGFNNYRQFMEQTSAKESTRTVLIGNNPFTCDCTLYEFVRYLKSSATDKPAITFNTKGATCFSPIEKNGTTLEKLDHKEMTCLVDARKQCPEECKCYFRTFTKSMIVDCKGKLLDDFVPRFPRANGNATFIEVHLEENHLGYLEPGAFDDDVQYLNLSMNNLTSLEVGVIPNEIRVLDLRNNTLMMMSKKAAASVASGEKLEKLFISGNPITCECENFEFISRLQNNHKKIADYNDVACSDGRKISDISVGVLCGVSSWIIVLCVFIALVGFTSGIMFAAYYKYNTEIKVYCYAKGWFLWLITEEELDKDKKYDAFISHSHKDEGFVITELLPNLECGPEPFKLCVHFRDWLAGEFIPTQVVNSVNDSKRTIIILSANFLESVWGKLEFRAAHRSAIKEGRSRLIVIIYGEIGDTSNLDRELQTYLTMNTYIKWGDPWFWKKLRFAMPHRNPDFGKEVKASQVAEKKITLDDKLELITTKGSNSPTTPVAHDTPPHHAHANPMMDGYVITMDGLKVNGNAKHSDV